MHLFQENSFKYLEESYRSEDFLGFNQYVELYKTKLNKIKTSGVVGFIGPFGCGKTTFMNQIKQKDEDNLRINFEAWKYPNREDLRENFILDVAMHLEGSDFKQIQKKSKQEPESVLEAFLRDGIDKLVGNFLPSLKKYLFDRKKRQLCLIEQVLKEIFISLHTVQKNKTYSTIYVVIEDIDRSGDAGVYFLETLNYFLKNIKLGKGLRIIAIATIGNKEFVNNKESYLKCLDYIHYFPIQEFKSEEMIDKFLSLKQNGINYKNICGFFNYVGKNFQGYFTPRIFKHIFREVFIISQELGIKTREELLILFGFVTSKYIFTKQNDIDISYFDKRIMDIGPKLDGAIKGRSFLQSFFMATLHKKPFLVEDEQGNLVPKLMVYQNNEGLRFSFKEGSGKLIEKEKTNHNNNIINIRLNKKLLSI